MRILAIADEMFTSDLIDIAVQPARERGLEVEVRSWSFESRAAQQDEMLKVEQQGPGAVVVPEALTGPIDHDILVLQFAPVSAEVIASATALKAIFVNRAGVENVAMDEVAERGIRMFTAPGRNARAVAEFSVGLILAELRNIARSHADLKTGTWSIDFPNSEWTPELRGKCVGLVGYGRIARLVREMLTGFGCTFQAYDPVLEDAGVDIELVDLHHLMATSDVISLHAPLTPDRRHLIGARELGLTKPTAILVNTARAGLIDEVALAAALDSGRLGGAALDVFEHEPVSGDDPLIRSQRTTVTPHLAGTTLDGFLEGPRILARSLDALLDELAAVVAQD